MFHMPYSLLVFFLLCNPDHVVGRIILPREALPKRAPNISTSTSAAQTYNRSQVTPSASLLASYWDPDPPPLPTGASLVSEYNARFVATTMPPPFFPHPSDNNDQLRKNYADIRSGICRPSDSFCQFQASGQPLISAQDKAFDDQCVLWNDDCSGNRTFAIEKFFKDISYRNPQNILNNHCFNQDSLANLEDCDDYNPPDRLKLWQEMKAWMRSPECVSAQHEYSIVEDATPINASSDNLETCCGSCGLLAQNVDLFYWPNPDEEDVSCLSIVGNSVLPLDYGATTAVQSLPSPMFTKNLSTTYWACPAHRTTGLSYPPAGGSTSITYFDSYATTARITTIGSVTVKVPLYNPWSSSPCMETKAAPLYSNSSTAIGDTNASIYPHGNVPVNPSASIYPSSNLSVIPSSITQPNSLPVSTVVSGTVTL